ncbi:sensor histidine kinase [Saccharibacillus qingshengii]|uniref:sensor histidine kinase n=1 Tax=Saccharibacillus qingshengii TaxID=1763540 RepID=UPI00155624EB|nr:HAMP domain-containing sensor histidine kinase [Saccharibacillus qingshengii]
MSKKRQVPMKFRHSLMARYLMLVGLAIFLLPIIVLVVTAVYLGYTYFIWQPEKQQVDPEQGVSTAVLESGWHELAAKLDGADASKIVGVMREFHLKNPLVAVAAVDAQGRTIAEEPERSGIPDVWTAGWTAEFMKRANAYQAPEFTIVAFIGEGQDDMRDTGQGFLVAQVPRELTATTVPDQNLRLSQVFAVTLFVLLFILFAIMFWAFFYRIRRRLVRLQAAMTAYDEHGMPMPVGPERRRDEIAALGGTFDEMVAKLRAGREREREEEELRKKLIANLSHDLRTPLTVIRSHAYSLEQEPLGDRGRESLALMTRKLDDLGGLIDNLLSYTLIAAGRYPMRIEETDVLRIVRAAAAQWYPVFEKEQMEVDADLPDEALIWRMDREWLMRILDNLFQNAVRHAKEGRYIGLAHGPAGRDGRRPLQIRDKGPGLPAARQPESAAAAGAAEGNSIEAAPTAERSDVSAQANNPSASDGYRTVRRNPAEGAGIGLSIVDLMIREMQMQWSIESGEGGTVITIWPPASKPS